MKVLYPLEVEQIQNKRMIELGIVELSDYALPLVEDLLEIVRKVVK